MNFGQNTVQPVTSGGHKESVRLTHIPARGFLGKPGAGPQGMGCLGVGARARRRLGSGQGLLFHPSIYLEGWTPTSFSKVTTIPTIREPSLSIPSAGVSLFFGTVSPRITVRRTPLSLCLWPKPRKGVPRSKGLKHLPEEKDKRAARLILQNPLLRKLGFHGTERKSPFCTVLWGRCCPHIPGRRSLGARLWRE